MYGVDQRKVFEGVRRYSIGTTLDVVNVEHAVAQQFAQFGLCQAHVVPPSAHQLLFAYFAIELFRK